jgi:hypothetical protein
MREMTGRLAAKSVAALSEIRIHLLYLYSLAALRHTQTELYSRLLTTSNFSDGMGKELKQIMRKRCVDTYLSRQPGFSGFSGHSSAATIHEVELHDTFRHYVDLAQQDLAHTRDSVYNANSNEKFKWVSMPLADEMPNPFVPGKRYTASIANYSSLVKYSGQLIATDVNEKSRS